MHCKCYGKETRKKTKSTHLNTRYFFCLLELLRPIWKLNECRNPSAIHELNRKLDEFMLCLIQHIFRQFIIFVALDFLFVVVVVFLIFIRFTKLILNAIISQKCVFLFFFCLFFVFFVLCFCWFYRVSLKHFRWDEVA